MERTLQANEVVRGKIQTLKVLFLYNFLFCLLSYFLLYLIFYYINRDFLFITASKGGSASRDGAHIPQRVAQIPRDMDRFRGRRQLGRSGDRRSDGTCSVSERTFSVLWISSKFGASSSAPVFLRYLSTHASPVGRHVIARSVCNSPACIYDILLFIYHIYNNSSVYKIISLSTYLLSLYKIYFDRSKDLI